MLLLEETTARPLHPRDLLQDKVGNDIGYWVIKVRRNGSDIKLIIVRSRDGFTVAEKGTADILANTKNLKLVTAFINTFAGVGLRA